MQFLSCNVDKAHIAPRIIVGVMMVATGFHIFQANGLWLYAFALTALGLVAANSLVHTYNTTEEKPNSTFEFLLNLLVIVVMTALPPGTSPDVMYAGVHKIAFLATWFLALCGGLYFLPISKAKKYAEFA